jgi:hypothetical protein
MLAFGARGRRQRMQISMVPPPQVCRTRGSSSLPSPQTIEQLACRSRRKSRSRFRGQGLSRRAPACQCLYARFARLPFPHPTEGVPIAHAHRPPTHRFRDPGGAARPLSDALVCSGCAKLVSTQPGAGLEGWRCAECRTEPTPRAEPVPFVRPPDPPGPAVEVPIPGGVVRGRTVLDVIAASATSSAGSLPPFMPRTVEWRGPRRAGGLYVAG